MKTLRLLTFVAIVLLSGSAYAQAPAEKSDFFARVSQGHLHLEAGRTQAAIESYQEALNLFPDSPAVLFNLSIAFYMERNIEGAAMALEKMVRLSPEDPEALYNLGHVLLLQKKTLRAKEAFRKADSLPHCPAKFKELIQQGLALIGNLESLDPFSRDLAFFVIQDQAGMNPAPVAF
jgi:Flp pilus assembly protein TadD